MEVIQKKLNEIKPYENNPRVNDKAAQAVAESIKAYGFKSPIIADRDGVIICGHTRYKAAMKLQLDTVPVIIADDLTPEPVKAYRLADNKVADIAIWDNKKLLEELDNIGDELFTGFELGGLFDNVLNESDHAAIDENMFSLIYEATFRSDSKEKLEQLQKMWDGINNEGQNTDSGNIGQETGEQQAAPNGEKQN